MRFFAKLDLWLLRREQRQWWLNEEKVGQFLAQLRHKRPAGYRGARSGLRLLLGFLRDIGAVAPKSEPMVSSPSQRLADRYRAYLKEERGLDQATIYNYSRHIDQLLTEQFGARPVELRTLGTSQITAFIRRHAPRGGRGLVAQMLTGLRSFFRFARFRRLAALDLAAVVPAVPSWEMAGPPKHLPTEAVQRVLASCERCTVRGKRDYAILLLLARLGLRAGEIVAMQLDDIDWANGQLAVRSKKGGGWASLPLSIDVGRALAGCLKVRPPSPHRNVFVRGYAPYTPFSVSGPIAVLARKAIEKAHVKPARTGLVRRGHRPQPYIYSDDEIIRILDAARRNPSTPRYALKPHTLYCLFGLLIVTGMRLTEALNLKAEDIDWEQGVLSVGRAKFQKSRLVPLHKSTLRQLRDYIKRRDQFFAARDGWTGGGKEEAMEKADLSALIEAFFHKRLIAQRRVSPHTIASYRDAFGLLLVFAQRRMNRSPSQLALKDLSPSLVSDFLDQLEAERDNTARTRNLRLAAIRSFFRFVALEAPEQSGMIQRVLAIPNKRCQRPLIGFLTRAGVEALLEAVDCKSWIGRRDYASLLVAMQTGLRLSELTGLCREDVALGSGAHLQCIGKGRKQRCTRLSKTGSVAEFVGRTVGLEG